MACRLSLLSVRATSTTHRPRWRPTAESGAGGVLALPGGRWPLLACGRPFPVIENIGIQGALCSPSSRARAKPWTPRLTKTSGRAELGLHQRDELMEQMSLNNHQTQHKYGSNESEFRGNPECHRLRPPPELRYGKAGGCSLRQGWGAVCWGGQEVISL